MRVKANYKSGTFYNRIIDRHIPILNKCMDISQQAGSKRKSVSEIKNILCAILHSFQYEKLNNTTAAHSSLQG